MKKRLSIVFACLAVSALGARTAAASERVRLDADWRFQLGDVRRKVMPAQNTFVVPAWRWKDAGTNEPASGARNLALQNSAGNAWADCKPGEEVFKEKKGFAWFRAELPSVPGPHRILRFDSVDDAATVYLNGKELAKHRGWDEPFEVGVDSAWKEQGPNFLSILVENTGGPGKVNTVTLETDLGLNPAPLTADYDDHAWRRLHLPHDFVVESGFDAKGDVSHGSLIKNIGWYRKVFDLPAGDKGRSLWIDFDGIYRNSSVWLNGQLLGVHVSGYTSFRYDISKAANYGGKNVLAIKVDAKGSEGWWYEGGGIYRHVWLNKADPEHLAPWGIQVTADPVGEGASIVVRSELSRTLTRDSRFLMQQQILDPSGKTVLELSSPAQGAAVEQKGNLAKAALWSPQSPALYRLITRLTLDGKEIDRAETSFGIRSIRFDAEQGFLLNGKPLKIQGTCNHLDFAGIGIALPDSLFEHRIRKLQEMGSNAWRCSHNPPSPEFLDACDRLGMLVMDENRKLGDSPEILGQVESMVRRDRNHPSIILWSLCNEEGLQGSEQGRKMGSTMKKLILSLDRTRPITAAMNGGYGKGLSKVVDLQGFNYHDGDYEPYHQKYPKQPLFGSETASAVGTRGIYENDKERGYVSAYDVNFPDWAQSAEKAWKALAERPYMAGGFVWTGFDYRGEPTPYGWPCINSHFGILDTCGFPKDSYYYYQSWWSEKTVLHLFPHWDWKGQEGKEIDVWCHSNCERVELFLNGASLGSKDMPKLGHLQWKVAYHPGVLSAKGYRKGVLVAEDKVETTGKPASVHLEYLKRDLLADGEDILPVEVSILDAKGRRVPTAGDLIKFSVTGVGEIAGVGNGDPSSHEADHATERHAFNGRCLVLLRAGERPGPVFLKATSRGLNGAGAEFRAVLPKL